MIATPKQNGQGGSVDRGVIRGSLIIAAVAAVLASTQFIGGGPPPCPSLTKIDEEVTGAKFAFRYSTLEHRNDKIKQALDEQLDRVAELEINKDYRASSTPQEIDNRERQIAKDKKISAELDKMIAESDAQLLRSTMDWASACRAKAART